MESFYLTLPLNENKQHQGFFQTELDQNINLTGSWEVGLSEISFTKTWMNILTSQHIYLFYFDNNLAKSIGKHIIDDAIIPPGTYTKESLVFEINKVVAKHFDENLLRRNRDIEICKFPYIKFDNNANKFKLVPGTTKKHGYLFILPEAQLCETIGYDFQEIIVNCEELYEKYSKFRKENPAHSNHLPTDEAFMEPKYPFSLEKIKFLYVLSDICSDRLFGSTRKNLLRFVDVPHNSNYGDQVTISYNNPQYVLVKKNNFSNVTIKIRKEMNHRKHLESREDYVEFHGGFTIITLHFKKISNDKIPDLIAPTGRRSTPRAHIPGSASYTDRDQETLDSSVEKLVNKNKNNQWVPFNCDPLYYNDCEPKQPIIYTNLDNEDDNSQIESNIKTIEPDLIKLDNDNTQNANNQNSQQQNDVSNVQADSSINTPPQDSKININFCSDQNIKQTIEESILPKPPKLPEQPEQPKLPEQPEQPKLPEQTEQPKFPEQPEQPKLPEQPEQPKLPEQPEQPKLPEQAPEEDYSDLYYIKKDKEERERIKKAYEKLTDEQKIRQSKSLRKMQYEVDPEAEVIEYSDDEHIKMIDDLYAQLIYAPKRISITQCIPENNINVCKLKKVITYE
jgi:hypothetical protein